MLLRATVSKRAARRRWSNRTRWRAAAEPSEACARGKAGAILVAVAREAWPVAHPGAACPIHGRRSSRPSRAACFLLTTDIHDEVLIRPANSLTSSVTPAGLKAVSSP